MKAQIDRFVKEAVKQNFQNVKSISDREFLNTAIVDENLDSFVSIVMNYETIEQRDAREDSLLSRARPTQIFVKASLPKQTLIEYEKQRLEKIRLGLMKHRQKNSENELELEVIGIQNK